MIVATLVAANVFLGIGNLLTGGNPWVVAFNFSVATWIALAEALR